MLSSLFELHPITVDSPTRWVVGVVGGVLLDNGSRAIAFLEERAGSKLLY
jgi:hypothetical protein